MKSEGEERIDRGLRRSALVAIGLAVIVGGTYLALRKPRPRVPDPTLAPGATDTKPAREKSAREQAPVPFRDVAAEVGLVFTHENGATGAKLLPETLVGGVAIFDADGDGRQDVAFARGTKWTGDQFSSPPPSDQSSVQLFLNTTAREPGAAITFAPAIDCGLVSSIYAMGLAAGDYDGDGRVDLYVTGVGANQLFQNETPQGGPPQFADVTQRAKADPPSDHPRWGTSAGFFDADRDGDLDLLVGNYVRWSPEIDRRVDFRLAGIGRAYGPPTGFEGDDLLYLRNTGDGTFENATESAGFAIRNSLGHPTGKALGLIFVDPDQDGDLDVVVANDTVPKGFFVNDGAGLFKESAAECGLAFDRSGAATGAMGIDSGYLRAISGSRGEDLAIAIGNFANEPDSLYISRGRTANFSDDAIVEGLAAPTRSVLTFGLVLEDFDLDGDLDIAQANGHIEDQINRVQASQTHAQRGQFFVNSKDESPCFIELPASAIGDLGAPRIGRGLASADLDLDGDVDLVMTQAGGTVALLRNDRASGGHWLRVELKPGISGQGMIGAQIELESGGSLQRRLLSPTRSYLSQCELPMTFGLGASTKVDRLTIRWPNGQVQQVPVSGIDRTISVSAP